MCLIKSTCPPFMIYGSDLPQKRIVSYCLKENSHTKAKIKHTSSQLSPTLQEAPICNTGSEPMYYRVGTTGRPVESGQINSDSVHVTPDWFLCNFGLNHFSICLKS